ncbi:hypothetical protein V8E54_011754 [Elaphomyces granulatus]
MSALPDKDRANGDLSIQNKIRHYFHIIPLTVPSVDLDQTKFDDSSFSQALHSLLEVFEDLVDEGVRRRYDNRKPHFVESEQIHDFEECAKEYPWIVNNGARGKVIGVVPATLRITIDL